MDCKLADCTKDQIGETEAINHIHHEELVKRETSFDFFKPAWLQYSEGKINYFVASSFDTQEPMVKLRSIPAPSGVDNA